VLGRPPLKVGALNLDETDVMRRLEPILSYVPFMVAQNVTRQPAISLPLAWLKSGLPIGVQFVGRFGEEHLLLQLAAQISWSKKRPPVCG
jgi:amidase